MSKKIALSSNTSKLSLTSPAAAAVVASNIDLLTEILEQVPTKSLIKFKSVSKQWLSLISDSRFSREHTTRHQNPPPLPSGFYFYPVRKRWLSLNDQITGISVNGRPRMSLPSLSFLDGLGSETKLLHSSNGLMLCSTGEKSKDYVVCNLTTQKFVVLPTLAVVPYYRSQSYLVFDPKKSPYYKVAVVIFDSDTSQLGVYSSESGSWKITMLRPSIQDAVSAYWGYGALWNGAIVLMRCLGWRNCAEHGHFYFRLDIDAEKLSTTRVPPPDTNLSKKMMYFGECGGRLLRIQTQFNATEFRVFEMMDEEGSFRWAVKYVVDLAPLTLPKRKTCKFMVLSVMKVGPNENDLAVVLCVRGKVIQYNIECNTLTVYRGLNGRNFPAYINRPFLHFYHFIENLAPI